MDPTFHMTVSHNNDQLFLSRAEDNDNLQHPCQQEICQRSKQAHVTALPKDTMPKAEQKQ